MLYIYSAFRWCKNPNFEKLTLKTVLLSRVRYVRMTSTTREFARAPQLESLLCYYYASHMNFCWAPVFRAVIPFDKMEHGPLDSSIITLSWALQILPPCLWPTLGDISLYHRTLTINVLLSLVHVCLCYFCISTCNWITCDDRVQTRPKTTKQHWKWIKVEFIPYLSLSHMHAVAVVWDELRVRGGDDNNKWSEKESVSWSKWQWWQRNWFRLDIRQSSILLYCNMHQKPLSFQKKTKTKHWTSAEKTSQHGFPNCFRWVYTG